MIILPKSVKVFLRVASSNQHSVRRNISANQKPVLYGDMASPPVRFVMMTTALLNMDVDFRQIDLFQSENKTKSYAKINPLQKVPAMAINGHVICDSHAIALYLCRTSKSNKAQVLYPKDEDIKASVDEFIFYNSGTLFPIDSAIFTEFFAGGWPADEKKVKNWFSAIDYLEKKLQNQKWLTGDEMRLCDLCCAATVSSIDILLPLLEKYVNVKNWMKEFKKLPISELNYTGIKRLENFVNMCKQR